jgi:hypothetical protein
MRIAEKRVEGRGQIPIVSCRKKRAVCFWHTASLKQPC